MKFIEISLSPYWIEECTGWLLLGVFLMETHEHVHPSPAWRTTRPPDAATIASHQAQISLVASTDCLRSNRVLVTTANMPGRGYDRRN